MIFYTIRKIVLFLFFVLVFTGGQGFAHLKIEPHLIPESHPLKPALDEIFGNERVTADLKSLKKAGFQVLHQQERSYITVAKHPKLPKHLVKLYLDTETRVKRKVPGWKWLVRRCNGAKALKKAIKHHKSKYFKVPNKWLYKLPETKSKGQPVILLVERMNLVPEQENLDHWKNKITTAQLQEFYNIIKMANGTSYRADNVWLTKSGKYAFIDTEYPYREPNYKTITLYLSPSMTQFWNSLTKDQN